MTSPLDPSAEPVFLRLRRLYAQAGFDIRINLNPAFFSGWGDSLFCMLYKDGQPLATGGGGISISELYFFECLRSAASFSSIFVIGNSGGWGTLGLSLLWPDAEVIAIDCGMLEPPNKLYEAIDFDRHRGQTGNDFGIELTNDLARRNSLNVRVINGMSPDDLQQTIPSACSRPPDLVFIDGGHSNDQLIRDFQGLQGLVSPACVYVLHDVVNWRMEKGFQECARVSALESRILWRTSSGMAILFPADAPPALREVVTAFTEDDVQLAEFRRRAPRRKMASIIEKLPEESLLGKVKTGIKWANRQMRFRRDS